MCCQLHNSVVQDTEHHHIFEYIYSLKGTVINHKLQLSALVRPVFYFFIVQGDCLQPDSLYPCSSIAILG
jgi:hypothetical protein